MWALVIEDNQALREVLAEMLREVGFEILMARTGTEAMRFLDGVIPDLITLDINIPGASSLMVLQHIRRINGGECATVVVLSGDRAADHAAEAALADVFLMKPAGMNDLIELAERLARSSEATQPSGVDIRREMKKANPALFIDYRTPGSEY